MNCSGGEGALFLHKACKAGLAFVSPSRLQNGLVGEEREEVCAKEFCVWGERFSDGTGVIHFASFVAVVHSKGQ